MGNFKVTTADGGTPSPDTGLYISPLEIPYNGRVRSLRTCGFLLDPDANPQGTDAITLYFSLAVYRLTGNSYRRVSDVEDIPFNIHANATFGCQEKNYADDALPVVTKGDRTGLLIHSDDCNQLLVDPTPVYTCPVHVVMTDPLANCSQAFYFNSTRLDRTMPEEVNVVNGLPVNVFMNLEFTVGKLFDMSTFLLTSIIIPCINCDHYMCMLRLASLS